jgi:hypothetical protein
LENRRLLSGTTTRLVDEPITIGVPGFKDITFVATNGRKTAITVSAATASIMFPGPAALTFYQGHAFFPAGQVETISSIVIANAVPGKASLKEIGAYGTGSFDVGSIVGGNLGSIVAPDVNLTGSLTVGSIKKLTLASVSGATVSLGSSVSAVKLSGAFSGSLTAGHVGSFKAASLSHANITTTDAYSHGKLEIGSIDGGSGILDSNIISAGNIGSVKAGYLQGSVILAATNGTSTGAGQFPSVLVPQSTLAIVAPAMIKSVTLSSKLITSPAYFMDSIIGADTIGSLQLGQLNGGGGVAGQKIGSFSATGPSGALNRFAFHLGEKQLHSAAKVQATLTNLDIPFTTVSGLPDDTLFYAFKLNILT